MNYNQENLEVNTSVSTSGGQKKSRATSRIITLDEDPIKFEPIDDEFSNQDILSQDFSGEKIEEKKEPMPTEQSGNITF
ncbi:MAG: hypothetical protein OSJ70_02955 [Bacilli bacterium]|nr:hypothetical protein [Bacilli bacterium]